jgi:RNA polymerase sigma factor (sigma-70 family)
VPSAPLNALPFDVLELPDGRRVIERFEVSYVPSASVYAALRRRALDADGEAVSRTGVRGVLAFGAPDRPRRSGIARWDTLPPLPSAAAEAREVAAVTSRSLVRLGRDASEAALKRGPLADVSVLHFASHAVVDPAGLRGTALLLARSAAGTLATRGCAVWSPPSSRRAREGWRRLCGRSRTRRSGVSCAGCTRGWRGGNRAPPPFAVPSSTRYATALRRGTGRRWSCGVTHRSGRFYRDRPKAPTAGPPPDLADRCTRATLGVSRLATRAYMVAISPCVSPPVSLPVPTVIRSDSVSRALESVLTRYSGVLRTVGARYRLPTADLDELTQEVRVRLWGALSTNERIDAVSPSYLYRAATTAAIDIVRRRRATRGESLDLVDDAELSARRAPETPERDASLKEIGERVEEALQSIAASRRPVVRMYLAGYGTTEIGELMGWTEAKARNLVYRGLADLRLRLRAMGIDGPGNGDTR